MPRELLDVHGGHPRINMLGHIMGVHAVVYEVRGRVDHRVRRGVDLVPHAEGGGVPHAEARDVLHIVLESRHTAAQWRGSGGQQVHGRGLLHRHQLRSRQLWFRGMVPIFREQVLRTPRTRENISLTIENVTPGLLQAVLHRLCSLLEWRGLTFKNRSMSSGCIMSRASMSSSTAKASDIESTDVPDVLLP